MKQAPSRGPLSTNAPFRQRGSPSLNLKARFVFQQAGQSKGGPIELYVIRSARSERDNRQVIATMMRRMASLRVGGPGAEGDEPRARNRHLADRPFGPRKPISNSASGTPLTIQRSGKTPPSAFKVRRAAGEGFCTSGLADQRLSRPVRSRYLFRPASQISGWRLSGLPKWGRFSPNPEVIQGISGKAQSVLAPPEETIWLLTPRMSLDVF
jgi:hypothetical protein